MCRNIKQLRRVDRPPSEEELHEAALQFVRKISGYRKPSSANEEAFQQAVAEIAAVSGRLFSRLAIKGQSW